MKKAVILHGTGATPNSNWFNWLKLQLEGRGYIVWLPQLPGADMPNAKRYTEFLLENNWDFQNNLIIGHSSGAVEIFSLLQHLNAAVDVKTAVLVGAFAEVLADEPDWSQLKGLFSEPFDFKTIKSKADTFLFVHGDNDPWCDPEQAKQLSQQVGGEYVEIAGGQHFSTSLDPAYTEYPALIALLEKRELL